MQHRSPSAAPASAGKFELARHRDVQPPDEPVPYGLVGRGRRFHSYFTSVASTSLNECTPRESVCGLVNADGIVLGVAVLFCQSISKYFVRYRRPGDAEQVHGFPSRPGTNELQARNRG